MDNLHIKNEVKAIAGACYTDFKLFCKTMFPSAFFGPWTTLHNDVIDLLDSNERYTAIAAPRGIGKTTMCRAYAAKNILYRDKYFIPYVMKSHDAALLQTENLKRDLTTNKDVRKIFGNVKARTLDDRDFQESFSKKSWVAYNSLIMPRGYGQAIRGLVYMDHRPDLFIIDDLEDDDQIENPEYRKSLKVWFNSVLIKAISRFSSDWRIIYIDTLKHEDSLLQTLLDSPSWTSIRLELCSVVGDKVTSNIPELSSDAELQADYDYHDDEGILDIFFREYRNLPLAGKNATFQKKYFKYYNPGEIIAKVGIQWLVILDPAKTANIASADSAIVGIGIDALNHAIYIQDIVHGKMKPDEIYEELFSMAWRLNASVIGIEVTGLEEFIKQPIINEASKRGCDATLVWLKARAGHKDEKGKDRRISSLAPYYRQGHIYHNADVCAVLEKQLESFPRSKLKDVMDATAYVVEMMSIGDIYFPQTESNPDVDDATSMESIYADLQLDSDIALNQRSYQII